MIPAGAPAPDFDEPLELLEACHERLEARLATLERMGPYLEERGCDDSVRQAVRSLLRYFDGAAPDHHRDEEDDLFPLLAERARAAGRGDVETALAELREEHRALERAYGRLRPQLAALVEGRAARLDARLAAEFAALYRGHIARENGLVMPYARKTLAAGERRALGASMAARRARRMDGAAR